MNEIWKPIPGFDNYEVSNLGRVKSLFDGRHKIFREKILKPTPDRKGYLFVFLCKEGKKKRFRVHRLVASAFLENPKNLEQVNHKDECKTNNRVENLEWCDARYNTNYGTRIERVAKAKSKKVLQFTKNGEFVREWQSMNECGRRGFHQGNVWSCCRGEQKSHKGFIWKYSEEVPSVSENDQGDSP